MIKDKLYLYVLIYTEGDSSWACTPASTKPPNCDFSSKGRQIGWIRQVRPKFVHLAALPRFKLCILHWKETWYPVSQNCELSFRSLRLAVNDYEHIRNSRASEDMDMNKHRAT